MYSWFKLHLVQIFVKPLCANGTEFLQTYGITVSSFLRIDFSSCYGNASYVGASSPHEVQKTNSQAHSNTIKTWLSSPLKLNSYFTIRNDSWGMWKLCRIFNWCHSLSNQNGDIGRVVVYGLKPKFKSYHEKYQARVRGFKSGSVVMSSKVVEGFKTIWGNACQHSVTHLAELLEDLSMDSNQTIWGCDLQQHSGRF
jgi:hypothetical protein